MYNKTKSNMNNLKNKPTSKKSSSNCYVLTEKDFYPIEDTRVYESLVEDISGGDNFGDYANWFFEEYEDEIFDN